MSRFPLRPEPVGQELAAASSPPDWDRVFGFHGPLELEIGCGQGGFAIEYCQRHPTSRYVAFEWRKKYAREVQARGDKRGLKNLRVVEADARYVVPKLFAPGSLSAFHLQFPDPWWKRSHQKRAVLTPQFARLLYELLEPGGLFDLRTDVEERARRMLTLLEGTGFHNPLGPGAFHPAAADEVPSTRERRYLRTGEPVFRARLTRPAGP